MNDAADAPGSASDPAAHGFVLLQDHRPPSGVRYYEFRRTEFVAPHREANTRSYTARMRSR